MIGGYERIGKISETQILLGKGRYKSDLQNRYEMVKHGYDLLVLTYSFSVYRLRIRFDTNMSTLNVLLRL